jgi:hypothetical protein
MAKKTAIQNFKLSEETKKEFNDLCEENHTSASHELRQFVHAKIKEFKEQKQ